MIFELSESTMTSDGAGSQTSHSQRTNETPRLEVHYFALEGQA